MTEFSPAKDAMDILIEDSTTPKSVREKLKGMKEYLDGDDDEQRKISTVLSELDDLSSDVNIPPYVRTQLYAISSALEAIGN